MKPRKVLRARQGRTQQAIKNLARRLYVSLTGEFWQLLGYTDNEGNTETLEEVEVFSGVGFESRPKAGNDAEVIVINLNSDGSHPVIVATRDKSIELSVDVDETAIFNSTGAKVHITKDGDIIVRCLSGRTVSVDDGSGAVALATKADIDALESWADSHTHAHGDPTTGIPSSGAPSASGTSVLKGK